MKRTELVGVARKKATEIVTGLLVTAAISVFAYAAKAYADNTYLRADIYTEFELKDDIESLDTEIRALDYSIRDAEIRGKISIQKGDDLEAGRAENDKNFYEREKDTLVRKRTDKRTQLNSTR